MDDAWFRFWNLRFYFYHNASFDPAYYCRCVKITFRHFQFRMFRGARTKNSHRVLIGILDGGKCQPNRERQEKAPAKSFETSLHLTKMYYFLKIPLVASLIQTWWWYSIVKWGLISKLFARALSWLSQNWWTFLFQPNVWTMCSLPSKKW